MSSTQTRIALSPLDHNAPRNYSNSVFYFSLKPGVGATEVFDVLQEGLHRTFEQLPWLNGTVHRQSQSEGGEGWRPGQLEIRYEALGPKPHHQLRRKELSSPMSYGELKEESFPAGVFDDATLAWAPVMPDIDSGPHVFIAQANFMPGACILTYALYHTAGDGAAYYEVAKLWAANCYILSPLSDVLPPPTPEADRQDRTLPERIWAREGGAARSPHSIDRSTWTLLGVDYADTQTSQATAPQTLTSTATATATATPNVRVMDAGVFYISPANFQALQQECSREAGVPISGTDALCALIWRGLLKARTAVAGTTAAAAADAEARLDMILDGRTDFSPFFPPDYLGNFTVTKQTTMALGSLVSPDTRVASVATAIRNGGGGAIDQSRLLDMYTLLRSVPDFDQLSRWKALRRSRVDKPTLLITSLLPFPFEQLSFGGDRIFGNGGTPDALRVLMGAFNRSTRLCLLMSRKRNGGIEFFLNLFPEEMELLLDDTEFGKYAMFVS